MSVVAVSNFDSAEHARVSRLVLRSGRLWLIMPVLGVISISYAVYSIGKDWGEYAALPLFISAFPWLLIGVLWLVIVPASLWLHAKRLPRWDPSLAGPLERVLDESGFHFRGSGVNLDIPWNMMHHARETEEFLLFFYNKKAAYYIPKRALTTGALAEARNLMRKYLGPRAAI